MKIPDYDAIANILTLRYDPASLQKRSLSVADLRPLPLNFETATAHVLEIIRRDLLDLRVKNVALLLSGGVDSIITLAMLRRFRPDIRVSCTSMGFADSDDEVGAAQKIARKFDCDFEAVIKEDILSDLPSLIWAVKEPRWNLYQYYAFRAARSKSSTLFSGDGGDELFGGYTFRYQKYLSIIQGIAPWNTKAQTYLLCHERDWVPDQESVFGPKIRFSWKKIYSLLRSNFDNTLAPLDQVFLADYNGKLLCDWIPANTAFAKVLDAKITSLFLTDRMTNYATHIPWQLKYCPETATGKLPLRSILKKQRVMIKAVKKGFSIDPVKLWNKYAREITERYVNSDSAIVAEGIISAEWVRKTHANLKVKQDIRYVNKMLGILALEVWWRLFVRGDMKKNERL